MSLSLISKSLEAFPPFVIALSKFVIAAPPSARTTSPSKSPSRSGWAA